ncbi:MAG: transposase [Deferribacteraceae bacterium]|nr:transposase [Deferribacteraceae bacterium]
MSTRDISEQTNVIESLNNQYRRINRNCSVFPSEESLIKALYLAVIIQKNEFLHCLFF